MTTRNAELLSTLPDGLSQEAIQYFLASKSASTIKLYTSAYTGFQRWCSDTGMDPANPSAVDLGVYLSRIAEKYAYSTVVIHMSAVVYFRPKMLDDWRHRLFLKETVRGIRNSKDLAKTQAAAITVSDLHKILATCSRNPIGARDRALLLTCFAGAFRRTELVNINVEHITWNDDGVTIFIPCSKGDQQGRGERVTICYGSNPETCPVAALKDWLRIRGTTEGPLFRSLTKSGRVKAKRLIDKQVTRILAERCEMASVVAPEGRRLSSHGLRSGFVTEAYKAGVSDEEIMGHTRHHSVSGMRSYIRRERLPDTPVSAKIGL